MKKDIEELEQRFKELKTKHSESDWNDVTYLMDLATKLETTDMPLAYRVAQHAKSLNSDNQDAINLYERLRANVKGQFPGVFTMTSKETKLKKALSNINMDKKVVQEKATGTFKTVKKKLKKSPVIGFVFIPWFLFSFYLTFVATERYESIAQIIVKQPDTVAAPIPEMALFSGLGGSSDGALVQAYIYSADLIEYLKLNTDIVSHYTDTNVDFFSRLPSDYEKEEFYEFYQKHVTVEIDAASQIISIGVQGFTPEFAQSLNEQIVDRTEWYINSISQKLAEQQLIFINEEHERISAKFADARKALLNFQEKYNLLNPEAEGSAMQSITYGLENQIVSKETELLALRRVMSDDSVEVQKAKNQLQALKSQLMSERAKLSTSSSNEDIPVSQIMARFQELKVNVEIALKSFTSSLMLIEKARVEVYQQVKYLVTVQKPVEPQKTAYPKVWYNILLFGFVALIAYGICRIVLATVKELG